MNLILGVSFIPFLCLLNVLQTEFFFNTVIKCSISQLFCNLCKLKKKKLFFQMVQATIMLEDMIKTEYLMNGWWYWSSLSAAAKTSTVSSLSLRIYSLDAAIAYEKILSDIDLTDNPKLSSKPDPKPVPNLDAMEKSKLGRKQNKRRKESEG